MHTEPIAVRREKYVAGLLIRVIVCLIFIGVVAITASLVPPNARQSFVYAVVILLLLAAINYPLWLLGKAKDFPLEHFYGHWCVDLILVTFVLHVLGGVEVPCGFVGYMIMIITSAVFLSQQAAFLVATGSAVFFDTLVISEGIGMIPHQSNIWEHHYTTAAQVITVLGSNVFFYLFALLTGSLSEQLKSANSALAKAQEELQEYNRGLETSVRDRTVALEEKNREIQEFVHIVTHDLRNVAVGAFEVARRLGGLEGERFSEKGRRYLANLLEDTGNINRMLSHLLALFRVDHEKERLEAVEMLPLVNEIVSANRRRLEEKAIEVEVGALPRVVVDPLQMRHVMANLIDNAIKYTGDRPGPRITIECAEDGKSYCFAVRDNGIGMSHDQAARIFQLYHRGTDQLVGGVEQDGQGVGLAITKRIVERWGGAIWVESEARGGSTFFFTCPRQEAYEQKAVVGA